MNLLKKQNISLIAFSALTACGVTLEYVPLNASPHPMTPKSPDKVEMYVGRKPTRDFVDVGLIESHGPLNPEKLLGKMRQDAAERGCDALVVVDSNNIPTGSGGVIAGYRGICVVYK